MLIKIGFLVLFLMNDLCVLNRASQFMPAVLHCYLIIKGLYVERKSNKNRYCFNGEFARIHLHASGNFRATQQYIDFRNFPHGNEYYLFVLQTSSYVIQLFILYQ